MATAFAAAVVLTVPFAAGAETLADSSATTGSGVSIVASAAAPSSKDAATTGSKTDATAGVADATVDQQPATVRTVTRDAPSSTGGGDEVGPRGAALGGGGSIVRTAPGSTPAKVCPSNVTGTTATVTTPTSVNGVEGTTTDDLATFAATYNSIRVANCLQPIPLANFEYDSCLQARIFWMADDPSSNAASAWGHTSTAKRSDGLPITGCDGDLDGGMSYTGATVATDWWNSIDHRDSLYQPLEKGSVADICIAFAMTHGGYNKTPPDEPITFVRAIAVWEDC